LGVVLAELFANALDHGVLGLASGLKDGSDGFARFFEARADALERLTHGSIAVHLELQRGAGAGAALTVRLRDSGAGFKREATEAAAATQRHGRGIALVRALCASLEYNAAGNEVSAVYVMEEPAAEPLRAVA